MGTSKSSTGPGKDVGLVPQWLDVPAGPAPRPELPPAVEPPGGDAPSPPPPPVTPAPPLPQWAPPRRFTDARRAVRDFIRTGDRGRLRSGLASYVRQGYRGSRTASARMGQAATSAAKAYDVLSRVADGTITPQELGFDPVDLAGAPMDDVVDALVGAICANDTTLDDVAGREAVSEALSEVLEAVPGLDLLTMPLEHTREVWLRTLAYHVFENIMLDLGVGLQRAAEGNAVLLNDRRFEVKGFVLECYREQVEALEAAGRRLDRNTCDAVSREVSGLVLDVYGGWTE